MSEVYPIGVKSVLNPITDAFCWLMAFAMTATFVPLNNAIGMGGTFWLFAGFTFLGIPFAMYVLVETKSKTREEIQRILGEMKTDWSPEYNWPKFRLNPLNLRLNLNLVRNFWKK